MIEFISLHRREAPLCSTLPSAHEEAWNSSPRLLFGRERRLAESAAALARLASGAPQTLLVAGEAGIGKTSLVEHIGAQARGQGFELAFGHCLDVETGALLGPVYKPAGHSLGRRPAKLLPPVAAGSRRTCVARRSPTPRSPRGCSAICSWW